MKKILDKCDAKLATLSCSMKSNKFRKGDGVFTMVIAAAIGTLVLIGFYIVAKGGLTSWGNSIKTLVTM